MALFVKKLLIGLLASLTALANLLSPVATVLPITTLTLPNGNRLIAELARTPAERERGLSDRASLAPDHGMLFVFPADTQPGFWMKEMNFPLDFIWLARGGEIIALNQNVSTSTYPELFLPPLPIREVLEVPAGYVAQQQLKLGEIIRKEL